MRYEPGWLYDWHEYDGSEWRPVLVEEMKALSFLGKPFDDGAREVLAFASSVAAGQSRPVPGSCWPVTDVGAEMCAFTRKGVVLLYAVGAPQAEDGQRAVFLLKCAKARSTHPAVADIREAERRLRAWRTRDRADDPVG